MVSYLILIILIIFQKKRLAFYGKTNLDELDNEIIQLLTENGKIPIISQYFRKNEFEQVA
jgi:hypothetical protein